MNTELRPSKQLALIIQLAATWHFDQFDKGGRPYVLHVLKVMHYLKDKSDDELNCIAVGHDLLEDTLVTAEALHGEGISQRVIEGIQCLTKVKGQKPEDYLRGILGSYDACRVKLADLRHNTDIRRLKGLGEKDLQRMKKYHKMHTQITTMIAWYESTPVIWYDSWNKMRLEYVNQVMEMFNENQDH